MQLFILLIAIHHVQSAMNVWRQGDTFHFDLMLHFLIYSYVSELGDVPFLLLSCFWLCCHVSEFAVMFFLLLLHFQICLFVVFHCTIFLLILILCFWFYCWVLCFMVCCHVFGSVTCFAFTGYHNHKVWIKKTQKNNKKAFF